MSKKRSNGKKNSAQVAIVMGSDTDLKTMQEAADVLGEFGISYDVQVISAHRTPEEMADFAKSASESGYSVIIAGAGGAAHLPGMIASLTELPVIGVPVPVGALQGQDALFSIVQMPKGVPVATVAIGNAYNAGLLAAQILGVSDLKIRSAIAKYKNGLKEKVRGMQRRLEAAR